MLKYNGVNIKMYVLLHISGYSECYVSEYVSQTCSWMHVYVKTYSVVHRAEVTHIKALPI